MTNTTHSLPLAERKTAVEEMLKSLEDKTDFASSLMRSSLDSHLSDVREQLNESETSSDQREVVEMRLSGASVDSGTTPAQLLSNVLKHFNSGIARAAHKIVTGRDSQKTSSAIHELLDLRFYRLQPGSARVTLTASSNGDLAGNTTKETLDQVFNFLESLDSEERFIDQVSNIGLNSLNSFNALANDIAKSSLSVSLNWPDAESGRSHSWRAGKAEFELLKARTKSIDIRRTSVERLDGIVTLVGEKGVLSLRTDAGEEVRARFSEKLLDSVQASCHLGSKITADFDVTTIGNTTVQVQKKSYLLKQIV
ncbi:hypothetical protein [Marinobacterium stanieri]|uniref:Uncharacterized protein n=1 Tax=Marinobacterium stanieri TaxID=49186 RepID=A0A1N6QBU0_9GAMM|nr:hypothetical protein [Marinobacterium stanieri]SIQ14070.1 hypothetical protein SAMN05421647_102405 [Marinobacterium stanieri]